MMLSDIRGILVWLAFCLIATTGAMTSAQETSAGRPSVPPPDRERIGKLKQKVDRMVVEAAQANPELKAMHEAQIAKMRAAQEKWNELVAASPELKKIQDEIEAARKRERELAREVISKNPELSEMQRQLRELNQKYEAKVREVLGAAPEVAETRKAIFELQGKLHAALKDNPDFKKLNDESDAAWNELVKRAAALNPELAKAIEERDALLKSAAVEPPKPAEKPADQKPEPAK